MLTLKIERSRFEMIACGTQKEVYRGYDEQQRLFNLWGKDISGWKNPQYVSFETGDEPDTRACVALCTLAMGEGYPEWGAEKGGTYLIIKVQKIIEVSEPVAEITKEVTQNLGKAEESLEEVEQETKEASELVEEEEEVETEEEPVKEAVVAIEEKEAEVTEPCKEESEAEVADEEAVPSDKI